MGATVEPRRVIRPLFVMFTPGISRITVPPSISRTPPAGIVRLPVTEIRESSFQEVIGSSTPETGVHGVGSIVTDRADWSGPTEALKAKLAVLVVRLTPDPA